MNQRYSPLTQVTAANVSRLKGVWLTHLRKSGVAAKYSAEGQPLEYKGVIYVPTGADDVFAVDVASGKILWQHEAHLYQDISTLCCGWISRGVALGDASCTSASWTESWSRSTRRRQHRLVDQVARWQDGYTITSAPLYYNGRVYTGALRRRVPGPRPGHGFQREDRQGIVALLTRSLARQDRSRHLAADR